LGWPLTTVYQDDLEALPGRNLQQGRGEVAIAQDQFVSQQLGMDGQWRNGSGEHQPGKRQALHSIAAFFTNPGVDEFVVQFTAFEPGRDPGFLVGMTSEGAVTAGWQDAESQLIFTRPQQLHVVAV